MRSLFQLALVFLATLLTNAVQGQDYLDALRREREQQTGTAITILFDNSGSMEGEKIRQAKSAFRAWLTTVPEDYKYSLITFEDNGRLAVPLGEHTREIVAQRVAELRANTDTPICGALRIAREQIEKRRREVTLYERHVVLIFTDGQENRDRRGIDGVRADIQTLRKQAVEVVGVGFHGEGDYMDGVATRFALANNEHELKKGLAKVDAEIGDADGLVVSADDLAALKRFVPTPALPIAVVASAQVADPASAPPTATPSSRRGHFNWLILLFVLWAAFRVAGRLQKGR